MKIYEFAIDEKYYYIVGEYAAPSSRRYIDGGELFDEIIKRKHMNEQDAAYIIRQLLSAITYCHSKGVVHRDLKPENILIESIGPNGKINIKVIDFGAALFFSPKTRFSETLGTPYYIAPEVLLGSYNEKCDIWSVGVILFVLLSGTAPFNGVTDDDIMNAVKKGTYSFSSTFSPTTKDVDRIWDSVSDLAKDLIQKMLTYNPDKRISAAESYKHAWLQTKEMNPLSADRTQELISNLSKFYVLSPGIYPER